jgi:hypothetical protein
MPAPEPADARPSVYLVLGAAGSGRRAIIADLIEGGLEGRGTVCVYLPDESAPADDEPLEKTGARLLHWHCEPGDALAPGSIDAPEPPADAAALFILAHGQANPVDQLECLRDWLEDHGLPLTRALTIVHCELEHAHPEVAAWHDACIHFSDAVLLNRRENVPQKFAADRIQAHRKKALPGLIEYVKKNRVDNPQRILEPQPRRLSLVFDPEDGADLEEEDLEEMADELDLPEEADDTEPYSLEGREEPYFERLPNGQRKKRLPDIGAILAQFGTPR